MGFLKSIGLLGWVSIGVCAVILAGLLAFKLTEPARARQEAASARAGAEQAKGAERGATAAVSVIDGHAAATEDRANIERGAVDDIQSQPGASAPVDRGVASAGLRGLCQSPSYRDSPRCAELRRANP